MPEESHETGRTNLERRLIERAQKDEAFRKELISNPKAIIEKELGVDLPKGIEIRVLEETPETLYLVLPSISDVAKPKDVQHKYPRLEGFWDGC